MVIIELYKLRYLKIERMKMRNLEITMGPTFELLALPSSVARVIPIGPPVRSSST